MMEIIYLYTHVVTFLGIRLSAGQWALDKCRALADRPATATFPKHKSVEAMAVNHCSVTLASNTLQAAEVHLP